LIEQPGRDAALLGLGVVAQLADAPRSALIEVAGVQQRADLDPERGVRLLPLELHAGDPTLAARFWELADVADPAPSTDWHRPGIDDRLRASEAEIAILQVDDALCSGPLDSRLQALDELVQERADGWVAQLLAAAEAPDNQQPGLRTLLVAIYRQLCRISDPRVAQLLWQRLRSEDDELARVISTGLWQQPGLVERLPAAVLAHWSSEPDYGYRLLLAAIDANLSWPDELMGKTPGAVRDKLRREGVWPAGAA
jgi:hypothetical protein